MGSFCSGESVHIACVLFTAHVCCSHLVCGLVDSVALYAACITLSPPTHPIHGSHCIHYSHIFVVSSDVNKTIKLLQVEADQQLELEMETQMTLEHFLSQMVALKNAFAMLSDVVMHEVDAARSEARRRIDASDARVNSSQTTIDNLIHEYGQLSNRVTSVEDKQDQILQELVALRTQGDQTAAWLKTVAEQVSVVKEDITGVNNKQIEHNAGVVKECSQLKVHWESQSQKIVSKINECSSEVSKQRTELTTTSQQRMDDLELLEKALSTLQVSHAAQSGKSQVTLLYAPFKSAAPSSHHYSTPLSKAPRWVRRG